MKFEKLTDSKIRIIFTLEDMLSHEISAQEFFANNTISQEVIQNVLNEAEKEIGFKTDDSKLLVEAIASSEGGCIFTITKLSPYTVLPGLSYIPHNCLLKFYDLNDFLDLCTYFKNMNNADVLNNFSLFLYNGIYYLNIAVTLPNTLFNALLEFGELIPHTYKIDGILQEYGKKII